MWERRFEAKPGQGWMLGMLRVGDHGVALAHVEGHEEIWDWQVGQAGFLAGEHNQAVADTFGADILRAARAAAAYGLIEKSLPPPPKGGFRCSGRNGTGAADHSPTDETAGVDASLVFQCRWCGGRWRLTKVERPGSVEWRTTALSAERP